MRRVENQYMDYEDRSFGGPSPSDYQDGIFSGQFNFGQPPVQPVQPIVQPVQQIQPVQPIVQPVQPIQPVQPPSPTDNLLKQILGQGTTNWSGVGYGSAEKNAEDMAKILAGIGITDINQFGRITRPVEQYMGTDDSGNPIYQTQEEQTFGNKLTGQAVPLTYGGRQSGNFFGGTYEGKGNTGYGVYFDEQGNPRFYTQGASSSDIGKLAPLLTMASFVPGLAPVAQGINALLAAKSGNVLGAISGAAGLGGLTDIANAANFAGALKSGNPLAAITTGANLGGVDLGGLVDASGIKDFTRIGDYDITDVVKAAQTAKAIKTGDPSAIISAIGGYMGGRDEQPSEPSPAEPYEEPITGSSRFANRVAPDPFASAGNETVPSIEMPDLNELLPRLAVAPIEQPESPVASTPIAPAPRRVASQQPTYDPVGGGRGRQGGATAEEIAAYNRSQLPGSKPKTAGDFFTSLFPSAEASTLTGRKADLASQIPGQSYTAPPSNYDENNSVFGRLGDALGLPQEFQRNLSNTLNALPGVNLPIGGAGRYVGKAADKVDDVLDPNWHTASGQRIYYNPDANRWTPRDQSFQDFIGRNALEAQGSVQKVFQKALDALEKGNYEESFAILDKNPTAQKMMLEKASFMGAHGVGPSRQLQHLGALDSPPAYTLNQGSGQYSVVERFYGKGKTPNVPRVNPPPQVPKVPEGYQRSGNRPPGGRAEGGLASLSKSNKR
jgi:hypothetical protein